MASMFMPSSTGMLGKIAGKAGGTAAELAKTRTPGVQNVRATLDQLLAGPDFALPGGGSFDTSAGPFAQATRTEIPAATLPLYQADPARLMGLTRTEGGATALGAEQDTLKQGTTAAIQRQLELLLQNLGFGGAAAGLGGGAFGALSRLLGI